MSKRFMLVGALLGAAMLMKAKDGETPEAGAPAASSGKDVEKNNEDNIEAEIDKGNNLENTADEAAAQIAKDHKERKVEETKRIMLKSAYARGKQLLVVRRNKRRNETGKDYLKALTTLDEELRGGKHDKISYEKGFKEAFKKRDEKLREIDKTYNEYVQKLKALYPTCWCFDWDYNID